MSQQIHIPAPKYEMHEFVTLHWNLQAYPTRIVRCWYRLDTEDWWYQVAAVSNEIEEDRFFPECVLKTRS